MNAPIYKYFQKFKVYNFYQLIIEYFYQEKKARVWGFHGKWKNWLMNTSIEIEDTYPEDDDEDKESSEPTSDDDFTPPSHSKKPRATKEFKVI